jgi:hypothetical protein
MKHRIVYIAVMVAMGCSHGTPLRLPGAIPAPERSRKKPASDVTAIIPMAWSPSRRLLWSDFLGSPQMGSAASATTAYTISYEGECDGSRFTFRVSTSFLPDRSWVKPAVLGSSLDSQRVLQHEQTHFDLGEVHARQLRRALGELTNPCDGPPDNRNAIVARVMRLDDETQRRYDSETESGVNVSLQMEWQTRVARQLTALNSYRAK